MTNLHLALISAVISLIAGIVGYYRVRAFITALIGTLRYELLQTERTLRSHVNDEVDQLQTHTSSLYGSTVTEIRRTEEAVLSFIQSHATDLAEAAASIKAHSIETHDRAVSRDISPRQAVTRN